MSAPYRLIVESGSRAGQVFPIGAAGGLIGQQNDNLVALPDPYLAPQHARLDWYQGFLYLSDLGSGGSTRVNGQPVSGPIALRPGDIIDVGSSRLRVDVGGAAPTMPTPVVGGFTAPQQPPGPPLAAPPARDRRVWWYVGGGVAALLLCCVASIAIFVGVVIRATAGPRDVATGYYQALGAHDWNKAQGYLIADTTLTASKLQSTWTALEARNGAFQSVSANSTNIVNTSATVKGTIKFKSKSESFTLNLVKESGKWKIDQR